MAFKSHSKDILILHDAKTKWLESNHGVLTEVAIKLRVSPQAVSQCFWGSTRSKRIERALRQIYAPGFRARRRAA